MAKHTNKRPLLPKQSSNEIVLAYIHAMRETLVHTVVVIPLLKAMGFKHVQYLHGASERGKDIGYVVQDHFADERFEVCQVKNEALSGRADSTNNTIGVLNQIRTAKSLAALNPSNNQKQLPDGVLLISTYDLPDKDVADGAAFLTQLRNEQVKIIGPDKLISLIKQYLPLWYNQIAFPGQAVAARLNVYLDTHHERIAFESTRTSDLTSLFVNLSISPLTPLMHNISHGAVGLSTRRCNDNYILATRTRTALEQCHKVLPFGLPGERLIRIPKAKGAGAGRALLDTTEGARAVQPKFTAEFVSRISQLLRQICDEVEAKNDPKACGERLDEFVECIRFLSQIDETFDGLFVRGDSDEPLESFSFPRLIPDIDPEMLLHLRSNISLVGELGAGKTSVARALARKALAGGRKVVYFPCLMLQSEQKGLRSTMTSFLRSLVSDAPEESILAYVAEAELFILDGCDEAGISKLALEEMISDLAFPETIKITVPKDFVCEIPYDLGTKVSYEKKTSVLSVTAPLTRTDKRRLVASAIGRSSIESVNSLIVAVERGSPHVIVTTRLTTLVEVPSTFITLALQPFDDVQLDCFMEKWCVQCCKPAGKLSEFMNENSHIREVCRTPLVASLVAALFENGYDLPKTRTEVYEKRFQLLLGKWDRIKNVGRRMVIQEKDKLLFLSTLAWTLHLKRQRRFTKSHAKRVWKKGFGDAYPDSDFDDVFHEFVSSCNVIIPEEGDTYSLGHLSYQEFLTARAVMYRQELELLVAKIDDPWWVQVAIFYVGLTGDASKLGRKLINRNGLPSGADFAESIMAEARYTSRVAADFLSSYSESSDDDR